MVLYRAEAGTHLRARFSVGLASILHSWHVLRLRELPFRLLSVHSDPLEEFHPLDRNSPNHDPSPICGHVTAFGDYEIFGNSERVCMY